MRNAFRVGLVGAMVAVYGVTGGPAGATPPGPGVTGTVLFQKTVGGTDYIYREITLPAHQSTGWHYHDGNLYAVVKQGTLSHFHSDCMSDGVYPRGSAFVEKGGTGNVHIGRNLGDTPVVLDVLYVLPHGSPLSEDAPNPGCDFQ
ncbi:cupin domain-containing protein [Actinoallomurus acaciae]|uniref:Cupin domain-containing protein n=1 Tax=Actinoallomurus acaciae TaxID=502577 RepID=A0ABV5YNK0_9ACTN